MKAAIAVVGPTASGKTDLALELAERLDTEIISADSMQFYRGMEIGTAAPTPEQRRRVKHHFVSFLSPSEAFSAGAFEVDARKAVGQLNAGGKPGIVVGGSGLYICALLDGLFPGPAKNESVRRRLRREAHDEGVPALYARLECVDPGYARVINRGDLRRIVRALEVYELTGRPLSELHREHREQAGTLPALQVALEYPREVLYERINLRVDAMIEEGFLEEVQALLDAGFGDDIERLRTLGYREMAAHLRGECSLDEAKEATRMHTRRYAKRQLSWFRADSRVHWLSVSPGVPPASFADTVMALFEQEDEEQQARRVFGRRDATE